MVSVRAANERLFRVPEYSNLGYKSQAKSHNGSMVDIGLPGVSLRESPAALHFSPKAMPPLPSLTKKYYHAPYPTIDPTRPELSAEGKNILIIGGGSGIGQATALAFIQANAKTMVLVGRRLSALQETQRLATQLGRSTIVVEFAVDILEMDAVSDLVRDVTVQYGPIDVCFNAAGYLSDSATLKSSRLSDFWAAFDVGLKGLFIVTQQFLHHCAPSDAVLISVSSIAAHLPAADVASPASYAASKIAAAKMIEYAAAENPGVRCYSLHPGIVETDMQRKSLAMLSEAQRRNLPTVFDDGQ